MSEIIDRTIHQDRIAEAVSAVKAATPLVGSITNFVTVDFVANAQLAAGGSAAMAYMPDEVEALISMGRAFYVNVGTLVPSLEETACHAASVSHEQGKPWVLDPVGIGFGSARTRILAHMRGCAPTIIRCNASEAIALAQAWGLDVQGAAAAVKGVDSTDAVESARAAAVSLARFTKGAVAVSGEVDLVTDGKTVALCSGGSSLMGKVTGFGCSLGGVAAVYSALADPFTAALAASSAYKLAAARAAQQASAPASFKVAFLDALFEASPEDIARNPFSIEEA